MHIDAVDPDRPDRDGERFAPIGIFARQLPGRPVRADRQRWRASAQQGCRIIFRGPCPDPWLQKAAAGDDHWPVGAVIGIG